ncbi:aldo/keto reductase [Pelagicoccus sp. NFK12]|uniref:Aldo/keto reductase n=1 Tax=Pelagicoccus enzymogenes TaxID=2773457 RepID=A0A927F4J2_9BACT|nr:aldo/keto reductase [Pelagicoccus enzymogenes]MBD5778012.1 aldo/keto reductase [Pelagicoccus enzymogenes]MDQ8197932.1 aldo/keto reductase [Pelagicoccus enzymogenes]
MQYRRLGKSGLQVSALSFGSWVTFGDQASNKTAEACLQLAYDSGINFFDNAEGYANGQSEEVMGSAIAKAGWARDTFVVSSKVFWGGEKPNQVGLSKKHVIEACEAALKRLRVDYLDLYYCHRPDPDTPIEETVRAMDVLIQQGKILYWGTSEWSAAEIMEAYSIARQYHLTPPTMEQPEYNLLKRHRFEVEYARLYSQIGLGTTTFSPLAGGILTGKYNDGIPPDSRLAYTEFDWMQEKLARLQAQGGIQVLQELTAIAQKLGASLPQLSIAWLLKNPNVSSVILGASRPEQLEQNLKALDILDTLNDEIMDEIEIAISRFQEIDA